MSVSQSNTADLDVDLGRLFGSLGRRWKRVLILTILVAGGAFVLASLATPKFRSETRLLIESRESVFTRSNANSEIDKPILDEEGVTSQVEVITSTDILTQVAKTFDLAHLKEFQDSSGLAALSQLLVLAGMKSDPAAISPEERVLQKFREKLNVYRVEKSRVIVVQFSSQDPKLAADVPNAIADAYLVLQRDAKRESNSDATTWLKPEIDALTIRVKDAEAKVANYRSQSDLLVGNNNSVLATQQLSELSTELSRVRAARSAAEASAASVRTALASGKSLDALPDVLSSNLVQRLRERQVQLKAQIADLSTTLGDNHPRIRALRSQLADLDVQIRSAAQNVLQSLSTQTETAKLREQQLVSDLNSQKVASARAGEEEVELRALEREASAQRELLESYLSRYREASSRRDGNYLPADARVFSRALPPVEPYFPKVLPITVAAAVAALLLTAVVTLLQELFSGRAMRPAANRTEAMAVLAPAAVAQPAPVLVVPEPPPAVRAVPTEPAERKLEQARASAPASPADAAKRLIVSSAKRAIFVSPEGEEATAASVLVARDVADAGLRVLLLDLSESGASSRTMLDSGTYPGITNLLTAEAQFGDVIRADHYSDCHVIPVGTANPALAMRAADRLPIIMESLTTAYDLVIVESGATDEEGLDRLVAQRTVVMVGVVEAEHEAVAETTKRLEDAGFEPQAVQVAQVEAPEAGRSAA